MPVKLPYCRLSSVSSFGCDFLNLMEQGSCSSHVPIVHCLRSLVADPPGPVFTDTPFIPEETACYPSASELFFCSS